MGGECFAPPLLRMQEGRSFWSILMKKLENLKNFKSDPNKIKKKLDIIDEGPSSDPMELRFHHFMS